MMIKENEMTLNDLICYADNNNIDFNSDLLMISEEYAEGDSVLSENHVSVAIQHNRGNRIMFIPKRMTEDLNIKHDLKKRKIDTIMTEVNSSNMMISIEHKILNSDDVKKILKDELNFKDFAEVSVISNNIIIQVSEKAKIDTIKSRFYGYSVLFDKMNKIWFTDSDMPYRWEYGEKVENTDKYDNVNQ